MKRPMVIAVLCGVIASICVALYLSSLENTYRQGAQKIQVLAAKQYIDQGTMIDASLVEEKTVPKEYVQPRAVAAIKELAGPEGRPVFMTIVPIEKGEQLVTTKLSTLGADTGIASLIPGDHRAVTLLCDRPFVNGVVRPGNRVDVIGVFSYEDADRRPQEGAFTLLQNRLVLTVGGSFLGMSHASDPDGKIKETELDDGSIPVSLSVMPEEAEKLVLASEKGTVRFALRPVGDYREENMKGVKLQDIARDMNVTARQVQPGQGRNMETPEARQKQREVMELLKKYQAK